MRRIFFFCLISGRTMSTDTDLVYIHRNSNSGVTAHITCFYCFSYRDIASGRQGQFARSWESFVPLSDRLQPPFWALEREKKLGRLRAGADLLPALGALLGVENFFAQADGFRGDLYEFVVGDELDGFFQRH